MTTAFLTSKYAGIGMLINEQVQAQIAPNPYAHLPSVSTEDMVQLMRIDKTLGAPRIAGYIDNAYDTVNGELPVIFFSLLTLQRHLFQKQIDKDAFDRTYKRAVMNEAAAIIADNYVDYDTTSQGAISGDVQLTKSDRLRRIVSHCIADITGRRRNRVKLL